MTRSVHPDLARRYAWLPRGVGRRWLLPILRCVFRLMTRTHPPTLQLPHGPPLYVSRPAGEATEPRPGLLWMHGGGLFMGHPLQGSYWVQQVADELGIVMVAVLYRLAPEHPFPAALDDCEQALRWLAEQPDVDANRVVIGGVSAGGGLAAALCQRVRGTDLTPAGQILVYPMLDDRTTVSDAEAAPLRLWDRASNALGWSSYLQGASEEPPPFAVPARADDLSGLPPAWIGVGTLDLFHDEDSTYAERLRAAGVPVQFEGVEGAYHAFDVVDPEAPVVRAFHRSLRASLEQMIHPRPA